MGRFSCVDVILVNLGTPDAPSEVHVRRYLRAFLSDKRVVEMPALLWWFVLNCLVLWRRPKKVAQDYRAIWGQDSPLRVHTLAQAAALTPHLQGAHVHAAMVYGKPNLVTLLKTLHARGRRNFVILPLYPQYSGTTTGAVFDRVARFGMSMRDVPALSFVRQYYDHALYIQALADKIARHRQTHGACDVLVFSFHGIPKSYVHKGDPYESQCQATAALIACTLNLDEGAYRVAFASRFGAQEWTGPYLEDVLKELAAQGKRVQVVSPSFASDCLETLNEIALEYRDLFLTAGGRAFEYIPALNADPDHIHLLADICLKHIEGHALNAPHANLPPAQ